MGYSTALGLSLTLPLDQAIAVHFASNCVPAIPQRCVPTAMLAVNEARGGKWDARIELPLGVTTHEGITVSTVDACMREWHLWAFLAISCRPSEGDTTRRIVPNER
jgi:hypothetical protein